MALPRITIEAVAENIRKNGLKQITGEFFGYDSDGNIVAACAIGQAAENMGHTPYAIQAWLNDYVDPDNEVTRIDCQQNKSDNYECGVPLYGLASYVEHLNDDHDWSFEKIADELLTYTDWKYYYEGK